RAADLIELAVPAAQRSRQEATLLGWLKALPVELFRRRPVLSITYAGTLLQSGEFEGIEDRLRDAERWLDSPASNRAQQEGSPAEPVIRDEEEFRNIPASLAMYRAAMALASGELSSTIAYAQQVLELVSGDDHFRRGAATALLG